MLPRSSRTAILAGFLLVLPALPTSLPAQSPGTGTLLEPGGIPATSRAATSRSESLYIVELTNPLATRFGTAVHEPPDLTIARALRRTDLQENGTARAVAGVFRLASLPGTLLLAGALYGIGEIEDRPDLSDLGMHTGQAIIAASGVTLVGKVAAGRARPRVSPEDAADFGLGRGFRGNDYQAFPSAHTSAAFAAGTVLATDIADRHPGSGRWVYPTIYAAASMAGLSRLFDEEHWATDIVAGALIGIGGGLLVNELHDES